MYHARRFIHGLPISNLTCFFFLSAKTIYRTVDARKVARGVINRVTGGR